MTDSKRSRGALAARASTPRLSRCSGRATAISASRLVLSSDLPEVEPSRIAKRTRPVSAASGSPAFRAEARDRHRCVSRPCSSRRACPRSRRQSIQVGVARIEAQLPARGRRSQIHELGVDAKIWSAATSSSPSLRTREPFADAARRAAPACRRAGCGPDAVQLDAPVERGSAPAQRERARREATRRAASPRARAAAPPSRRDRRETRARSMRMRSPPLSSARRVQIAQRQLEIVEAEQRRPARARCVR